MNQWHVIKTVAGVALLSLGASPPACTPQSRGKVVSRYSASVSAPTASPGPKGPTLEGPTLRDQALKGTVAIESVTPNAGFSGEYLVSVSYSPAPGESGSPFEIRLKDRQGSPIQIQSRKATSCVGSQRCIFAWLKRNGTQIGDLKVVVAQGGREVVSAVEPSQVRKPISALELNRLTDPNWGTVADISEPTTQIGPMVFEPSSSEVSVTSGIKSLLPFSCGNVQAIQLVDGSQTMSLESTGLGSGGTCGAYLTANREGDYSVTLKATNPNASPTEKQTALIVRVRPAQPVASQFLDFPDAASVTTHQEYRVSGRCSGIGEIGYSVTAAGKIEGGMNNTHLRLEKKSGGACDLVVYGYSLPVGNYILKVWPVENPSLKKSVQLEIKQGSAVENSQRIFRLTVDKTQAAFGSLMTGQVGFGLSATGPCHQGITGVRLEGIKQVMSATNYFGSQVDASTPPALEARFSRKADGLCVVTVVLNRAGYFIARAVPTGSQDYSDLAVPFDTHVQEARKAVVFSIGSDGCTEPRLYAHDPRTPRLSGCVCIPELPNSTDKFREKVLTATNIKGQTRHLLATMTPTGSVFVREKAGSRDTTNGRLTLELGAAKDMSKGTQATGLIEVWLDDRDYYVQQSYWIPYQVKPRCP